MIVFIVIFQEDPELKALRIKVSTPESDATKMEIYAGKEFKETMAKWKPSAHNKAVTLRGWGTKEENQ